MIRHLLVVLAVGCGAPRSTVLTQHVDAPSIADYGASVDAADNQGAIQAALTANAGHAIRIPAGRWTVGRAGNAYYCLNIPPGTTLIGDSRESSALVQAAGIAPSVSLLEVDGPGVTVQSLTLDGQRVLQTVNEHRHGVFVRGAGFVARDVRVTAFTGDGIYLYNGANASTIDAVTCEGNGRNGMTYGGMISVGSVTGSTFRGNAAQQLDSEPGSPAHVDGIRITGSTFDATDGLGALVSNDYVLTVCGSSGGMSAGWTIDGNVITGGLYMVWARDVAASHNTGTNPTSKPAVTVYRAAANVTIGCAADATDLAACGNDLTSPAASYAVVVTGTGTGQAPAGVLIRGNRFNVGGATGIGAAGALNLTVSDNVIISPGGTGYAAISARATNPAVPTAGVTLLRNHATGWQRGIALSGMAGTTASIAMLTATSNSLGAGAWLDDGSGALQGARITGDDPALVARWPVGAVLTTDGATTVMTR